MALFDVHSHEVTVNTYKGLFIGCILAVSGNMLISVSLNLQKYTHIKDEEKSADEKLHYTKRPLWWLGIIMMVCGEVGNFSAFGYAPASVVAPLGSTTVVVNMFIAVSFLKEKLRPEDLFGVALAVVGAFLLVNFSSKVEFVMDAKDILDSLTQRAFLVYIFIEVITLIVLLVLLYRLKMENVLVLLLITAIIASFTVISAKACSNMIKLTFQGHSQLDQPIIYVMAIVMAVTAITQVKFLNHAMKLFHSTIVVPTNFVFFTISAITAGIVFYREMWGMTAIQVFMYLFGCCLCFIGVFFITTGRSGDSFDEDSAKKLMADILPTWLYSSYNRAPIQPRSPNSDTALLLSNQSDTDETSFQGDQELQEINNQNQPNQYGSQNGTKY